MKNIQFGILWEKTILYDGVTFEIALFWNGFLLATAEKLLR